MWRMSGDSTVADVASAARDGPSQERLFKLYTMCNQKKRVLMIIRKTARRDDISNDIEYQDSVIVVIPNAYLTRGQFSGESRTNLFQ